MKQVLSPKELAQAIGVSESSLKRWVDDGMISASRTAGGHRRIRVGEAIRFIRQTRAPVLHPELLGLSDVEAGRHGGAPAATAASETDHAERLFALLRDGQAAPARGLVLSHYLQGSTLADIADDVIRPAMSRLGKLWRHDETGIIVEHRATDVCIQAVQRLRAMLEPVVDGPVAVGGAPAGDPYILPSLLAATVLEVEGYKAMNLGPDTPAEELLRAAEHFGAQLVWLSVSFAENAPALRAAIGDVAERLSALGVKVIVGGQSAKALGLPLDGNVFVGDSMAELTAFARGLRAGGTLSESP